MKAKPRVKPKSKRKRKPKLDRKNLNIAALEAGMRRRYGLPHCIHCRNNYGRWLIADLIDKPRLFRKENTYISR